MKPSSRFGTGSKGVAPSLAEDFAQPKILDQLDHEVSLLGDIVWELGPGASAEYALALSPDGDLDWLPATRQVVALAPQLPNWEFHPARGPPVRGIRSSRWVTWK